MITPNDRPIGYFFLVAAICLLITEPSIAQIYKWTDEKGQIHFSDSKPEQATENKSFIALEDEKPTEMTVLNARDPSRAARPLLIAPPILPWSEYASGFIQAKQKKNIGLYHFGESCVSPTAMILPDALERHAGLFLSEPAIAGLVIEALRKKDYRGYWRPTKSGPTRQQFEDGLTIDMNVSSIKYQVCNKSSVHSYRTMSLDKFSSGSFSTKKVNMTVTWTVSNLKGDLLGKFTSSVKQISWQKDRSATQPFEWAIERALADLFSKKEFRSLLQDGYETPATNVQATDNSDSVSSLIEKSSEAYASLISKFASLTGFGNQAELSELLIIFQQIKTSSTQYYLDKGQWPDSLARIGIPADDYAASSDALKQIYTGADGAITMEVSESFGKNSMLEFRPNTSNNSIISWHCTSNISARDLPSSLECDPI